MLDEAKRENYGYAKVILDIMNKSIIAAERGIIEEACKAGVTCFSRNWNISQHQFVAVFFKLWDQSIQ